MATEQDYQTGTAALIVVVQAAIKSNVPDFLQGDVPQGLVNQITAQGAKAVIDAVDLLRSKSTS
jgi:hypothetical protein